MKQKTEVSATLLRLEQECGFEDGFKLLYCPWERISDARIAFISLNPGMAPDDSEMRAIEDPEGNSYYVERENTKSPLTHQFLEMCDFISSKPNDILTGAFFPFRSAKWSDLSALQIEEVLKFSQPFWKSAITENCELAVVLSNFVASQVVDLLDGKLEAEIPSGWGATKLRRYIAPNGTKVIQLPHLSTFKLFSREECVEPLKEVFQL